MRKGSPQNIPISDFKDAVGSNEDNAAMAAVSAARAVVMPDVPFVQFESNGVILIYGRDEVAIEAGNLLRDHLDVTVLIVPPAAISPGTVEFPVVKGRIQTATGHFGAFNVAIDDFAEPMPSSGAAPVFGPSRNGAHSQCDIILDLSGGPGLFAGANLRDGYLRAAPGSSPAMLEAVLKARDLSGSFEKPRYIAFSPSLCAHSRSGIVGCTRCLDLCPAGAITPAGDSVAIDPHICAGCGQCGATCPSGAASYAMPPADALVQKLRAMLLAYREAGGSHPIVLVHDSAHGSPLVDVLNRVGDGLPAHVLAFHVNEVTQVGLELIAAAFAYGASAMRFLLRARSRHDISGLRQSLALAEPILAGLGFDAIRVATIETDDPDALGSSLRAISPMLSAPRPASFRAIGGKREVLRFALNELHRAAPDPVDVIALPEGAPFGSVEVDARGCTLCLACVSACPTGALRDDPERPVLRFAEAACVQCGICEATCPEKVIALTPRINFGATTAPARILKEEEPFCCIQCNKPFGVKSTIERVAATLEGKHWMYPQSSRRADLIRMCGTCRMTVAAEESFEPYAGFGHSIRTTDDYLRDQDAAEKLGPLA